MADEFKSSMTSGSEWASDTMSTATKNMQSFANELAQMSKKSIEHASSTMEKLRDAKSFEELVSIQTSFMREALEAATQRTRRLGEMMTTLPLEMTRAYQDAMNRATDSAMKTTRAVGEKTTDMATRTMDNLPHA